MSIEPVPEITLSSSVRTLRGVGPAAEEGLLRAGIRTVGELLELWPSSYVDYSNPLPFSQAPEDGEGFFAVKVWSSPESYIGKKGVHVLSFQVVDRQGAQATVTVFNQSYLRGKLRPGLPIFLHGRLDTQGGIRRFTAPRVLTKMPDQLIAPVYRSINGIAPSRLRSVMRGAVTSTVITDYHTDAFLQRYDLLSLKEAYSAIHVPSSMRDIERGRRRFESDQGFILARVVDGISARHDIPNEAVVHAAPLIDEFLDRLSFTATHAQRRAMMEIASDLSGPFCMNRLLQGDVGSGKTVVALYAVYTMMQAGFQSMLLVPTEILAQQHAATARSILPADRVFLLTGGCSSAMREQTLARVRADSGAFLIGTHALLYHELGLETPALLIADEQHRFGVKQRQKLLMQPSGMHSLTMSATPIPRSLALAVHGQTHISVLNEYPSGRRVPRTCYVPPRKVQDMFEFIASRARLGAQAFIVCAAIDSSDQIPVHTALETYQSMKKRFPDVEIGLLHGQCSSNEKQNIMSSFAAGAISVLVSTTVIEVGIDVPNATVMAILDADRFGLAQLHQLRGRVGRGNSDSYCFLTSNAADSVRRIQILCSVSDGFRIAEEDLKERGAGDLLGERQHGVQGALTLLTDQESGRLRAMREELMHMSIEPSLVPDFRWFTSEASKQMEKLDELALN